MAAWWQSLTPLEHILLYLAVPATLILIIQTVLLFVGGVFDSDGAAGDGGLDADTDADADMDAAFEADPDGCGDPDAHLSPTKTERGTAFKACTSSPCGAWWPSWRSSAGAGSG